MDALETRLAHVEADLARLGSESEVRRLLNRYMFLCDVPLPEHGMSHDMRVEAIADLFTPDAVWEGVGAAHGASFGRHCGRDEIRAHFARFYAATDPRQVFNTHYVCSEQIHAGIDEADGRWVQFQPWIFDDGRSILRSSRLNVHFVKTNSGWLIARYRTENLFVADLPDMWASTLIERSVLMAPLT